MQSRIYGVIALWLLPTTYLLSAEQDWQSRLTFHASFDNGADASFATGDAHVYTAEDLTMKSVKPGLPDDVTIEEGGRGGGCLHFRDTTKAVAHFRGDKNMPYAEDGFDATLSFWLSLHPDEDLKPGYVDPLQVTDKKWNDASIFVDFTKDDTPRHFRLGVFSNLAFWNPKNLKWDQVPDSDRPMVTVKQTPFSRNEWTHVAITLKQINGNGESVCELYLNGASQGKLTQPQKFSWDPAKVAIMLGIQYIGRIDDLAIFRGAMSAQEVAELAGLKQGVSELHP